VLRCVAVWGAIPFRQTLQDNNKVKNDRLQKHGILQHPLWYPFNSWKNVSRKSKIEMTDGSKLCRKWSNWTEPPIPVYCMYVKFSSIFLLVYSAKIHSSATVVWYGSWENQLEAKRVFWIYVKWNVLIRTKWTPSRYHFYEKLTSAVWVSVKRNLR
jgi:hypothetical protein